MSAPDAMAASDEAFALELQRREIVAAHGFASDGWDQSPGQVSGTGHEAVPGQPRHNDVRMHIAAEMLRTQAERRGRNNNRNPKTTATVVTFIYMPQVVAALLVLNAHWAPEECDMSLHVWCLISALRQALLVTIVWTGALHQGQHRTQNASCLAKTLMRLHRPVEMFGLFWFVFGFLWILSAKECSITAPEVYTLTLSLLICHLAVLCLPCLVACLLLPCLCCCLPCFLRMARQVHNPMGTRGAQPDQIGTLPSMKYEPGCLGDDANCSICLSEYEAGEDIRRLPCGGSHVFHKACIDEWLQVNATCPHCRGQVFAEADGGRVAPDLEAGAGSGAGAGSDDLDRSVGSTVELVSHRSD